MQIKNECRLELSKIGNGQTKPPLILCVLKNPRALDTFLHANQMKMYTWDKIVNFRNFCSPLSFFQIMSLGRC